jgi:hypothetical protein
MLKHANSYSAERDTQGEEGQGKVSFWDVTEIGSVITILCETIEEHDGNGERHVALVSNAMIGNDKIISCVLRSTCLVASTVPAQMT